MKRILILLVFVVLASSAASAADWANRVTSMTQGQGQVDRLFDGPEGMTGIVIGPAQSAPDNGRILAWGMPDGLLVVGNVYDRNGRNLSEVVHRDKPEWFQSSADALEPSAGGENPVWADAVSFLATGRAVAEGQGRRVFVFTAFGCPYCEKLYREIHADPSILRKLEIVWVPVTRDGKDFSTAGILGGDLSALGGGNHSVSVTKEQEQIVRSNTQFLHDNGGKVSTPTAMVMEDGQALFLYGVNAAYLRKL